MEDTREEELAMEYTFDQVADLLDEMAETFPPVFFEQLNGGILLQEEAKPDPMFPEGEVYFMGEYVQDSYLGRYINLYYGSFLDSARNESWSEETWREELYTTLAHEFTHHVESLANAHGLDDKDEEELLRLLEKYRDAP
jgi:hypothetical protein